MARITRHTQELLSGIKELMAQGMSQRGRKEHLRLKVTRLSSPSGWCG